MNTIQQLEDGVRKLPADELAVFRAWFAEFDADTWDWQIQEDVSAGRLDWLVKEARQDQLDGRCTDR